MITFKSECHLPNKHGNLKYREYVNDYFRCHSSNKAGKELYGAQARELDSKLGLSDAHHNTVRRYLGIEE